ncbi:S9 family peptidase [Marinicella sp. S1101]|uniref:S9 family peptidase n=1 Tax=Marinicella marina TaxID=2996016 RepID=UPI002260B4D1|nr:S9 family peptidase [Marinicella marina]MCX7552737.1 S9 family peptidase [Marinicella marina]MDJ1139954.1 S9 family peptidase [Marinicella marina]
MKNQLTQIFYISLFLFVFNPTVWADEDPDLSAVNNPKHYTGMDVFDLQYVSDPRISPDGKQVVYRLNSNDIMTDKTHSNLWIIDVDGAKNRPLLTGKNSYTSPRWSPSGDRIAFVAASGGSPQIHLMWMDTGQVAVISDLRQPPASITWSPDGKYLAFTMAVPAKPSKLVKKRPQPKGAKWSEAAVVIDSIRYQRDGRGIIPTAFNHVFVLPANGGTERQLTTGNFQHQGPLSWSNDSQHLLFSANRDAGWERQTIESDVYQIDLLGKLTQITSEPGAENQPAYSPDGKKIAYIKTENLKLSYIKSTLVVINSDGSGANDLSKNFDVNIDDFAWAGNNKSLHIQYDQRAIRRLAEINLRGKISPKVQGISGTSNGRPYVSGDFSINDDEVIAYTKGSAYRPADLAVYKAKKHKVLTAVNEDLLGHKKLGEVHEIIYNSSLDQQQIQGWYITPPDFDPNKKYPLIIEIHGGPWLAYGPYFSAELQQMASAGYVVFYNNFRGSTGYGTDFAMLLHGKYSSADDFADHMSGIDALIDKGFVDEHNLFITGGSAGGIAAAYAVGLTNRFNAAVAAKPVINWVSKTLTADSSIGQIRHQFPGMPWDHLAHYWQRSPLSLVANVKTPTMLLTGEDDRRTPISETEQFYQALQLLNVDTMMVRIPDTPHGIADRPSRLLTKVDHILAWFERYKKDPE